MKKAMISLLLSYQKARSYKIHNLSNSNLKFNINNNNNNNFINNINNLCKTIAR